MSAIVADTSEWIEYFAGRPAPLLDHALAAGLVVVPPIVIAELLGGVRSAGDRSALEDVLRDLGMADTPFDHWSRVGALRAALRARGLSVSTPDAHVAQCALDLDAPLLTRDAVFGQIAKMTKLRLAPI
ncbi:MAG TPA: PIN domain-containing protein [Vicinamibacterales bacterium]|nr:PIN domain-containing protein [Vicinamibacterales bacterium]